VRLWSLRPDATEPPPDRASLWEDLAADPVTAYRAQWALLDDPKAAAALLRDRLAPEKATGDEQRIRKLIADLDSNQYRTRERAMRALRDAGCAAVPHLRAAQAKASPETAQRLSELLAGMTTAVTAPSDLRQLRAVQVLELGSTSETRAVLTEWAAGPPGTLLTEQAADALRRLAASR
jgi:hypothetical protein